MPEPAVCHRLRNARRALAARARVPAAAGLAAVLAWGCVSSGEHDALREEARALRQRARALEAEVERLGAANQSLSRERVRLLEEAEDLRETARAQEQQLLEFEREREALDAALREREEALEARMADIERLRQTYDELVADLESELEAGRIEVRQLREGLKLSLASDVLFASGSAELNPGGDRVLETVLDRVAGLPHQIAVEGHTDSVPIRDPAGAPFPSNWELAGARAARVVRWLVDAGIDPERLSAVSYGAHRPVAENDTREGRARNRRIEIRLIPEGDAEGGPVAAADDPAEAR